MLNLSSIGPHIYIDGRITLKIFFYLILKLFPVGCLVCRWFYRVKKLYSIHIQLVTKLQYFLSTIRGGTTTVKISNNKFIGIFYQFQYVNRINFLLGSPKKSLIHLLSLVKKIKKSSKENNGISLTSTPWHPHTETSNTEIINLQNYSTLSQLLDYVDLNKAGHFKQTSIL